MKETFNVSIPTFSTRKDVIFSKIITSFFGNLGVYNLFALKSIYNKPLLFNVNILFDTVNNNHNAQKVFIPLFIFDISLAIF